MRSVIIPVVADISSEAGRQSVVDAVQALNQPIHIIHNAAIIGVSTLKSLDEDLLRQAFETNYFAPVLFS